MSLASADLPSDPDALRAFALACQSELAAGYLQSQAFRLPPGLLAARVGHSCRRIPSHSRGKAVSGKAPPSGTRSITRCGMSPTFSTECGEVTAARGARPGSRRLDQLPPSLDQADAAAPAPAKRPSLPVRPAGSGQPAHSGPTSQLPSPTSWSPARGRSAPSIRGP
jgi:hypothetical protein